MAAMSSGLPTLPAGCALGAAEDTARPQSRRPYLCSPAQFVQGPICLPFIVIFALISLAPSRMIVSITPSKVFPA